MYLCNPLHYLSSAYKKTVKNPRPPHFTVLFLCHFLCMMNKNEYRTHRRSNFSTFLSRWQEILLKRLPFSRTGVIFSSSFSFVCLCMSFSNDIRKNHEKIIRKKRDDLLSGTKNFIRCNTFFNCFLPAKICS